MTTILIPVLDEEKNLSALFRALEAVQKKSPDAEIIFVDNGSQDDSVTLIERFCHLRPNARLLTEKKRGFAEPLNRGLAEAKGKTILFLDADALPAPNWVMEMEKALAHAEIAVGETKSQLTGRATPYGQVSLALFVRHSQLAAHAEGYAFPWGPTCNLGARRSVFERVDLFSPEAGGAFDMDWCWRAVLQGAKLTYAPQAKVNHKRRNEREALLAQFDRYGRAEAWLQRTYGFLTGSLEEVDPLQASLDAFQRLRARAQKPKGQAQTRALEEVAVAFASGVRAGYAGFFRPCPLKRPKPSQLIHWRNAQKGVTVFVPGKGITEFAGKGLKAWEALQGGVSDQEMAKLMTKLFRVPPKHALAEAVEFRKALGV